MCLGNLRDANAVRDHFLSRAGDLPVTPLDNFIRFLLLTLEVSCILPMTYFSFPPLDTGLGSSFSELSQRDAKPLFEMLLTKYSASLARDPSFKEYMLSIGT